MIGKPSFELAVGTHTISKRSGVLTFAQLVPAAADSTLMLYDVNAEADVATTNKLVGFAFDVDALKPELLSANPDLKFTEGLVAVVAGAGAVAYVGHKKG